VIIRGLQRLEGEEAVDQPGTERDRANAGSRLRRRDLLGNPGKRVREADLAGDNRMPTDGPGDAAFEDGLATSWPLQLTTAHPEPP
jgi:hypothetical protein